MKSSPCCYCWSIFLRFCFVSCADITIVTCSNYIHVALCCFGKVFLLEFFFLCTKKRNGNKAKMPLKLNTFCFNVLGAHICIYSRTRTRSLARQLIYSLLYAWNYYYFIHSGWDSYMSHRALLHMMVKQLFVFWASHSFNHPWMHICARNVNVMLKTCL